MEKMNETMVVDAITVAPATPVSAASDVVLSEGGTLEAQQKVRKPRAPKAPKAVVWIQLADGTRMIRPKGKPRLGSFIINPETGEALSEPVVSKPRKPRGLI